MSRDPKSTLYLCCFQSKRHSLAELATSETERYFQISSSKMHHLQGRHAKLKQFLDFCLAVFLDPPNQERGK